MQALTITLIDAGTWTAATSIIDPDDVDEPEQVLVATDASLPAGLVTSAPLWRRRAAARAIAEAVCVRLRRSLEPGEPIHRHGWHPDIEQDVDTFAWFIHDTSWRLGALR